MAIPVPTSVELAFGGNNRTASLGSNITPVGGLTMQSIYKVLFDTMPTRAADVLYATGVPQIGDSLAADGARPIMWVSNTRVVEVQEDRHFFHVLVEYSSLYPTTTATSTFPLVSIDFRERSIPAGKDTSGVNIVNKAGHPFDPAVTVTKTDMVMSLVVRSDTFSMTWPDTYVNTINQYAITILDRSFPATTLKMSRLGTSGWTSSYGELEWPIAYVIEYREDGWNKQNLVNAGFHGKNASGEMVKLQLDDGTYPSDPLPLAADGTKLPTATIAATGLIYLNFDLYEEADWSPLTIPATLPTW